MRSVERVVRSDSVIHVSMAVVTDSYDKTDLPTAATRPALRLRQHHRRLPFFPGWVAAYSAFSTPAREPAPDCP